MLCFSLKKKSTIFFRTVSSWTPEYYVLRETTEVRLYNRGKEMSRFFLNFSPFPGFSRSYLNDGNSLSSPTPKPEIRTRRRPGSNAPQSRPLSVLTYYFPVFRRSTRKVPSFSSRHFFISFPASRFFLYLQQIFNALLGLFLLKKFF